MVSDGFYSAITNIPLYILVGGGIDWINYECGINAQSFGAPDYFSAWGIGNTRLFWYKNASLYGICTSGSNVYNDGHRVGTSALTIHLGTATHVLEIG